MDTPQPLDKILTDLDLTSTKLVKASKEQLTCKQVQKARKGKNITLNIQGKVLRALNACVPAKKYCLNDIFAELSSDQGAITMKGDGA